MAQLPISQGFIERSIFGVVALVLSSALVRLLSSGNTDLVTSGDRRFEIVLVLLYFAVFLIGLVHIRGTIRFGLHTPPLIALLALTCVSFLWAELPGLVLRRTLGVAGATLFGLVLASRLDFGEQLAILRRVARFITALTYLAWVAGLMIGTNLVSGEGTVI